MESKNQILLIVSLLFSLSADATSLFPRNLIGLSPNPFPNFSPQLLQPVQSPSQSRSPVVPLISSSSLAFVDPTLKTICDTTDSPLLCLSSISPLFHGKIDLVSILKVAINVSYEYTNLALDETEHFAESRSTPLADVEHYADCYGFYTDAMDNFRDAMDYIDEHRNINKLKHSLHRASKDYKHCDDQFAAMNGGPFANYYDTLKQLVGNCKRIANLIHSL